MGLKKGLLIGVTSLFLTSNVACADDSAFTGFSAGAFFGFSWMDFDYTEDYVNAPGEINVSDLDGATGGIFLGYNHQIDNYVFGIEADLGLSGADEALDGKGTNNWSEFDVKWTSHIRAKAGMVFNDNTLVYLAAGLAIMEMENDDIDPGWNDDDATLTGWTVGAGVEYMATENIALRAEYLYDNFGNEDFELEAPGTAIGAYKGTADDLEIHTFRVGISYLF